jgi:hypothetical protein
MTAIAAAAQLTFNGGSSLPQRQQQWGEQMQERADEGR